MIQTLQVYQLTLMLILIGVCATLAVLTYFSKSMSSGRRSRLILIQLSAVILLVFDRYAYIYRGDESDIGYYMVRISNFMVFFMHAFLALAFSLYLIDLYSNEGGLKEMPRRFTAVFAMAVIDEILIIISQFTGLYYSFDEHNRYVRSPGYLYLLSYVMPVSMLIILLTVIIQNYNRLSRNISRSLLVFTIAPIVASIAQFFLYGLSLDNLAIVAASVLLYIFALKDMDERLEKANRVEIEYLKEEQRNMQELFGQTAEALASAIDAKDKYTHGHSTRVAEYSREIARLAGKDDEACEEIYFAALLHDVGKIGVPDSIITKDGRLTDEEFSAIKQHPVIGKQILASISQSPYLSIGANYHHERYDGRGYPERLKGEDIPEIARIIAVADAYDAMTSKRSYRDPIPQHKVREEIVKGTGTQFDPTFAKLMLHLIDRDEEYDMKEREEIRELAGRDSMVFYEYKEDASEGVLLNPFISRIKLRAETDEQYKGLEYIPSLIVFDSLDGRVYTDERKVGEMIYFEYAHIRLDGQVRCEGARKVETEIKELVPPAGIDMEEAYNKDLRYSIEAVRVRDHILVTITNVYKIVKVTIALPDSSRFAYMSLTGLHCLIKGVNISKDEESVDGDYIPRIAEEISYIDGPVGDIPNVQVDGWCSDTSEPIVIRDKMKIKFHTMSLPTARLIWHCPYIRLFYADDGKFDGEGYKDYVMVRLDGENWESDENATNKIIVHKEEDFNGWEEWKDINKKGMDCEIGITFKNRTITVTTVNQGIAVKSITKLVGNVPDTVYAVLTGDQVALTNIRIE